MTSTKIATSYYGKKISPQQAQKLAIQLAYKGTGYTWLNPLVGCVIVNKDDIVIATGYHKKWGEAHAEINALNAIKDKNDLNQATVYVTLEPCSHVGKTPSCAQTLIEYPIKKVVYGMTDPNPIVSGKGLDLLKKNQIQIEAFNHYQVDLNVLMESFICNQTQQRAFIALKVASSLDGQLALKNGQSKWITNESSRQLGHYLRGKHDALCIGAKTILTDNPLLNIRHPRFPKKNNKLIIIDPNEEFLKKIFNLKILQAHNKNDLIFIVDENIPHSYLFQYAQVRPLKKHFGLFNLQELSQCLYKDFQIGSVLIEGGAFTHSQFLLQKAFDRLYLFLAPKIFGDQTGLSWASHFGINDIDHSIKLKKLFFKKLDNDLLITGRS